MNDYGYLAIQFSMAIAAYLLIFRIYLQSWLRAQSFEAAVTPFLVVHIFRYLGLALLVTGQVDPAVSRDALGIMAYGDVASGISALVAVVAITFGSRFVVPLVVLFSVIGIADLITIGPTALNAGVIVSPIGTMWFFLVIFAPILLLSHIYIIVRLVRHFRSAARPAVP
ncbi:MAG: hypothetical protein WBA67_09525 [Jannaschia sp.]